MCSSDLMYYMLAPGIDPVETRYWANNRVACVDATFERFLQSVDQLIPSEVRKIPVNFGGGDLSIRQHYRVASASESAELQAYLVSDVSHVHS